MKRLRVLAIALVMVLSLTAGIFAVSKLAAKTIVKAAMSCCSDTSCCAEGNCKMGGDHASCPLKESAAKTSGVVTDNGTLSCSHAGETARVATEEGKSCCGSDASCCKGSTCCKGKKMTAGL